eukprot:GHVU01068574.1.p2 GENE.GHVU01068574.1~~GHVU01068574.1.p2  ORF type:complete len:121 (+),score=2.19 GHVU01068574.1:1501-1863(+)
MHLPHTHAARVNKSPMFHRSCTVAGCHRLVGDQPAHALLQTTIRCGKVIGVGREGNVYAGEVVRRCGLAYSCRPIRIEYANRSVGTGEIVVTYVVAIKVKVRNIYDDRESSRDVPPESLS